MFYTCHVTIYRSCISYCNEIDQIPLAKQYEVAISRSSSYVTCTPIIWPWIWTFPYQITRGFHVAFATGEGCKQETLTLLDTWLRPPFWTCILLRKRKRSDSVLWRKPSSFRKFYGRYGDLIQQYEVSLSRMLNNILILDQQWLPNQSDFPPISWHWYRTWPSPIMSGFHRAFATCVACQQGTLTLPDTWFRPPLWDLLVLQLLRPDSSNLPCLLSTFHLEYPLVVSRFCLYAVSVRNL